jgi:tubulin---tyrosine ligase
MIGQTVKPLYYRPSASIHGDDAEGSVHHRPSSTGNVEEWILVDGTPASCVQIGLHHFFSGRGPIDLVVSGPNYGRNTTAVFALSSGTLGGALEAAICKRKAIALSFAFFTRNHDPVIIEGACRHSVRVLEALYKQWPGDGSVDLYSVNVPLVEGVESHKTLWTGMLQNYWQDGSCFQEVDVAVGDEDEEEERIRAGEEAGPEPENQQEQKKTAGHKHMHFRWAPKFTDVYKSVEEAPPGNDGWAVKEGYTRFVILTAQRLTIPRLLICCSVTPLKANFWHPATELHKTELRL